MGPGNREEWRGRMTLAAGSELNAGLGEQNVRESALMLGLERNEKTKRNDEPILADERLKQRTLGERRD